MMIRLLILLALLWPSVSGAAVAYVQDDVCIAASGSSTTIACPFTSNVTAGSTIAVYCTSGGAGTTLTGVSDGTNTYTVVQHVDATPDGWTNATAYAANAAGGATTVTCTFQNSTDYRAAIIHEISGTATTTPLDKNAGQFQAAPGTGTDAITSGSVTTTTDGQYIFAVTKETNLGGCPGLTANAGTSYTIRDGSCGNSLVNIAGESRVQTSAGSIAGTFTQGSAGDANWVTMMMTFKEATAASAVHLLPLMGVGQ